MYKVIFALMAIGLLWTSFVYQNKQQEVITAPVEPAPYTPVKNAPSTPSFVAEESLSAFRCDGRTRCSQMTSCAEARFFLNNCPNTEMDGDGDRIPCEDQWCGH
jgi:hypothetical protein